MALRLGLAGLAGAAGTTAYSNRDSLVEGGASNLFRNAPTPYPGNTDLVHQLSNEVRSMAEAQRNSHSILVQTSQPTTVMGMEAWKVIGLVGTAGTIYMKAKGYELKDLVYVNKKLFTQVTDTLREQLDLVEQKVVEVKQELLERIGLAEERVADRIEGKIDEELGKVDDRMDGLQDGITRVESAMESNRLQVDGIATDITNVAGEVALSRNEMEKIDSKIDKMSNDTKQHLASLKGGLEKQSQGISLLCEFVCSQTNSKEGSSPQLLSELQNYAQSERSVRAIQTRALSQPIIRKKSAGLASVKSFPATA